MLVKINRADGGKTYFDTSAYAGFDLKPDGKTIRCIPIVKGGETITIQGEDTKQLLARLDGMIGGQRRKESIDAKKEPTVGART